MAAKTMVHYSFLCKRSSDQYWLNRSYSSLVYGGVWLLMKVEIVSWFLIIILNISLAVIMPTSLPSCSIIGSRLIFFNCIVSIVSLRERLDVMLIIGLLISPCTGVWNRVWSNEPIIRTRSLSVIIPTTSFWFPTLFFHVLFLIISTLPILFSNIVLEIAWMVWFSVWVITFLVITLDTGIVSKLIIR